MKKYLGIAILSIFLTYPCWAESNRQKIIRLEGQVDELAQSIYELQEIIQHFTAPSADSWGEPGLLLDSCDTAIAWFVESGDGVTISVTAISKIEGTGAIKVSVPPNVTAIVKVVNPDGWDLSSYNYLNAWVRKSGGRPMTGISGFNIQFGEMGYDEQEMGPTFLSGVGSNRLSWDISGIPVDQRNKVTVIAITIPNAIGYPLYVNIDYIHAN